ncbi:hypothetical protein HanLR1_Chr16g0643971 [Helianthus annuus]|nr:hypothetical protein HanHA89_Chr16g0684561 [Helianthus annuus]KAJ0642945.1 hypothetical protein HanLR1_Chr16g0643971 [Helianthus annuus]
MNRSGLITSNSVLTMLLDRLKREMPNKQPHNVMLREQILAFRIMRHQLRHSPRHNRLHLHRPFFQYLNKNRTHTRVNHMLHTLRIPPEQPDRQRSILLPLQLPLFRQLQQRIHPTLFNYQLPVSIVVTCQ